MSHTKHQPSQGESPSFQAEELTPAPTIQAEKPVPATTIPAEEPKPSPAIWLCPDVSNTIEQTRTLFLYKPPDAKHCYIENIGTSAGGRMKCAVVHYLTEPPALALMNGIRLFEIDEVRDLARVLKSKATAEHLQTVISNLRLPLCGHLSLSDLLVGKTLPLPKVVGGIANKYRCQCYGGRPWSPRRRHSLSCPVTTVCQACHTEGSYTAVGLVALQKGKDGTAKLGFVLQVWRELGCVMDESEPGWKCHALSSSTLADARGSWVRWVQFVKDEHSQWKISGDGPSGTGGGFLNTVRKLLRK